MSLEDLPNELIIHLATFLPPLDFVRFTLTSRRIFHLFNDNTLEWKKLLYQDLGEPCQTLEVTVDKLLKSGKALTENKWKLLYLMQKKTLMNWTRNKYHNFTCNQAGDLAFDTSGTTLTTFAHLEESFQGPPHIVIHVLDESTLEWMREEIYLPGEFLMDLELFRVEDVRCDQKKAVIKVATSIAVKRLLICFDVVLRKPVWGGVAGYFPLLDQDDTDIVNLHSNSYTIVCQRKTCVQVMMFNTETGARIHNYQLSGFRLSLFFQHCPLQKWLAFSISQVGGFRPQVFTLDLTGNEGMRRLDFIGDPFLENYPLAVLDHCAVLCENSSISVWDLDSRRCQYYIHLRNRYCFLSQLLTKSRSKVDMIVGGWLDSYPEGHSLHILKVQDDVATVIYSLDRDVVDPGFSRITFVGMQPILILKSASPKEEDKDKILMMVGRKDTYCQPHYWHRVKSLRDVKYLSVAQVGVSIDGFFKFFDFLHLDNYILNKSLS